MGEKKATPDRPANRAEMGSNFRRLIIGHATRTTFAVGRTINSYYIILDDDNGIFERPKGSVSDGPIAGAPDSLAKQ